MLCNVKCATYSIAKVNEDAFNVFSDCAWVLDGSTGLNGKRLVAGENGSDAQWYTAAFSNFLTKNLPNSTESLPKLFGRGVREVWEAFSSKADYIGQDDVPCTLAAAIRLRGNYLEYINVGDCTLLVRKKDGSVEEYSDHTLSGLDNNTLTLALQIAQEKGIPLCECRAHILPQLRTVRRSMNTPEGYISLANNEASVLKAKNGRIPLDEIRDICILSDGFSQYFKLFSLASDAADFMEKVASMQTKDLYDALLQAQKDDATLMNYPRFKLSDDATIVYAAIL